MRPTKLFWPALAAAAVLVMPLAYAQEEAAPADDVVMLPCDGQCVTITRNPRKISGADIVQPDQGPFGLQGPSGTRITQSGGIAEGFVELQYTIKADGSVANDVDILRLVGPQFFADVAKRTVRDWRYEPAMANGQPVSVTHQLRVFYGTSGVTGARRSVVTGYNGAVELIKDRKMEEADGKLTEMWRLPDLNFYERGMLLYLRAMIAMQRGDCLSARRESDLALAFGDANLSRTTHESLFRIKIDASLCFGDVVAATKTLAVFRKVFGIDTTDPVVTRVESLKKKLGELPSYAMDLKIPAAEEADGFGFYLYRRDFAFTKISGALFGFTAICRERQIDSPITDTAEWHIPNGWSDCAVWVRGRPGTTFQVVQFAAAKPAAK
jgi:hypothetical protein